jgi:hypothetical protein
MKQILLILGGCMGILTTQAQFSWNPDPTINNPVCTVFNTTNKTGLVSMTDGAGGMYMAWEDSRTSATTAADIYLQHIDVNGNLLLPAAGLPICTADSNQTNIVMTPDLAGGVVIAWQDNRASVASGDIYMQRVSAAGTLSWTANGIPAVNTTANQITPAITLVSLTEFAIVWRDGRNGNLDLYANKYNLATGASQWASDFAVVVQPNTQQRQQLLPDQLGGFFCVWEDQRISASEADIYLQRVSTLGTALWAANGVAICNASFNQLAPQLTTDAAGGVVVTWGDNRVAANDQNIYAQRVDNLGAVQWTANGVVVANPAGNQTNPLIVPGGSGSTILTWSDNRAAVSDRNVYVQKLDATGAAQWTANGVAICTAPLNQPQSATSLTMVPDNANGAILVWDDNRANDAALGLDIYAQRINSAGVVQWAANGSPVSIRTGSNQRSPVAVPDGIGGAVVAWPDARSTGASTAIEIHATRLLPTGPIPVVFSGISGQKIGSTIRVNWQISTEINTSHYELERSADGARFEKIGVVTAQNNANGTNYGYTDAQPFGGINYYRVVAVGRDGQRQYSSVVKIAMKDIAQPAITLFPLPAKERVTVRMEGASNGIHTLSVADMSGRTLLIRNVAVTGTVMQVDLAIDRLASGTYLVQWRDAKGQQMAHQRLQKL